MGLFVRKSNGPSDMYGAITYYVGNDGFVRKSNGPSDKYGAIAYYVGNDGFVRKSNGPSDMYGTIVYYVGNDGFVRKSNGPSDKYGAIVYYVDDNGFVRKSNGPSDKYGAIVYCIEKEAKTDNKQPDVNDKQDDGRGAGLGIALLAIAFVIGLIFAPILIILGMFGKFLLGGLFKNVLPIEAFKKFRKTYTIITIIWLVLGLAAIVVLAILESEAVEIALYSLVGGNVLLLILSIVIGNKIYNEHKHELPQPVEIDIEVEQTTQVSESISDTVVEEELVEDSVQIPEDAVQIPIDDTQKTLVAIKQLKELLDMGAITKSEFNEKKKALLGNIGSTQTKKVDKKAKKPFNSKLCFRINLILSVVAIITYIVGFVFLCFEKVDENFFRIPHSIREFSFFEVSFDLSPIDAWDWPEFPLTAIGAILSALCLVIQLICDLSKNKNANKSIIVDILAILSLTIAIVFGFITGEAIVFSILVSSSCLFVLLHLIMSIIIKCNIKKDV